RLRSSTRSINKLPVQSSTHSHYGFSPVYSVALSLKNRFNGDDILDSHTPGGQMKELPIACELTPAEMEERRQGVLPGLLAQAQERIAMADGFRWRFAPRSDLLAAVVQVIDLERQCCRFLRFELTVEPAAGPVWLEVTGPKGTAKFLEELTRQ
ncbi:MAG TPA: hypothetical protein VN920_02905, partial [Pyrinomonadaceae bacterium]|nr:hypothetical protein [Pyrinomonadaceae bacterium]